MKLKERNFAVEEEASKEIAVTISEYLFDFNKRKKKNKKTGEPIIVCVGTDLAIFDALGPLCGTLLKEKMPNVTLYGNLDFLQTAKNIRQTKTRLKRDYRNRPIIAIDAATTDEKNIGTIIVRNQPLRPGTGARKNLGNIGDVTVFGLTMCGYEWRDSSIRLGVVYSMAKSISDGVAIFLKEWKKK